MLLMHVEAFRNLPSDAKFSSLFLIWQIWNRLEKLQLTIEIFGKKTVEEKLIIITETEVFNMEKMKGDFSRITTKTKRELKALFLPCVYRMYEEVAQPLMELQPTVLELCFMLVHMSYIVIEKLGGLHDENIASKFMETVSDDLHDYYHRRMKVRNYAGRLIKMTSIVQKLEAVFRERQKALHLAKLFDVFKRKISEPCIFG